MLNFQRLITDWSDLIVIGEDPIKILEKSDDKRSKSKQVVEAPAI